MTVTPQITIEQSQLLVEVDGDSVVVTESQDRSADVIEVEVPGPPGAPKIIEADGTPVTPRPNLSFNGFEVSDDASNNRTVVTAPVTNITAHVHNQESASHIWTVNHNLGRIPITKCFTLGGVEFSAEVENPTVNQTVISHKFPIAGFSRHL